MRALNMQALTNDIKARHPGVTIYGIGDDAHKTRSSDHNEDDTAGSKAAQSDSDSTPEHRAIDVMLGPALNRNQMYAIINEILADPDDLARLWYMNFENWQWSRSNGWVKTDNSDDPHPSHGHFSGLASQDENSSPWLTGGGTDVLRATRGMGQNGAPPHDNVMYLQRLLNIAFEGDPRLTDPNNPAYHPLNVDGNYGGNTAYWVSVGLTGGAGDLVDGNWFGILVDMVVRKRAGQSVYTHNTDVPHGGGQLPDSIELEIPAYTVPAQTVTVPIES